MVKNFILKSKKIYIILGAGIMLCLLILTANISYGLGQQQAAAGQAQYSEEYLQRYAFLTWAYLDSFPNDTLENAKEYARLDCNLAVGK